MGSVGTSTSQYKREDFSIQRRIIGHKKTRTPEYNYTIHMNGNVLTESAMNVVFHTQKDAENFVDRIVSGDFKLTERYRWFKSH